MEGRGSGGPNICWRPCPLQMSQPASQKQSHCSWRRRTYTCTTKIIGGVSQSYCEKCRRWTKGTKEHTTVTHRDSRRGVPPPSAAPAASAPAPAPALAPVPSTIGGTGSLMPVTDDIEYTGGRLIFNGALFLGGLTGAKPEVEPTPDPPISSEDPLICPDDLFFSDAFCCKPRT